MSPAPRIVGLLVCASLFLAGCGSDALSKEDYIATADDICTSAQERAEDLAQPTDPGSAGAYADRLEEITTDYIGELRDLEPPEDDRERVTALIDDIEQAGLKIVEATRANSTGGSSAEAYAEALELAEHANEEASAYGFSACGISEGLAPH